MIQKYKKRFFLLAFIAVHFGYVSTVKELSLLTKKYIKIHKIKETKAVLGTGENRLKIRCKVGPDPQDFNCTGA